MSSSTSRYSGNRYPDASNFVKSESTEANHHSPPRLRSTTTTTSQRHDTYPIEMMMMHRHHHSNDLDHDSDDDSDNDGDDDDMNDDDIDIEDILREDDDDDDDVDEDYNDDFHHHSTIPNDVGHHSVPRLTTHTHFPDEEEEDDDDDDDDDFDVSLWKTAKLGVGMKILLPSTTVSTTTTTTTNGSTALTSNTNNITTETTVASSIRRNDKKNSTLDHLPEDWAVLQHILNTAEDDDDDDSDDDDDDFMHHAPHGRTNSTQYSSYHQNGNDDHVVMDDGIDVSQRHTTSMTSNLPTSFFRTKESVFHKTSQQQQQHHHQDRRDTIHSTSTTSNTMKNNHALRLVAEENGNNDDDDDEIIYERSMAYAHNLERKLFKSSHSSGSTSTNGPAREIVSPLMVKRRLKPRIELSARTTPTTTTQYVPSDPVHVQPPLPYHQPPHSTTSVGTKTSISSNTTKLFGPRFGFSGIVENKSMSTISTSICKHSTRGMTKVYCGLPTSLAFNTKFIAVGTQIGIILIYDLFEVLRQRLGAASHVDDAGNSTTDRSMAGAITSLDLSQNGDTVVAGYTSGLIVLWDTIRGMVLRSVTETHPSPITTIRFLRDLKVVSVDSSGLVHKMTFTKNLLWANYSIETECLLDGTAGQILAMHVLQPYQTVKPLLRPEKFSKVLRHLTLISLASERSSFAVAVEPKVHVLHRWARPPSDRTNVIVTDPSYQHKNSSSNNTHPTPDNDTVLSTDQFYLPCLAWGWALVSGGGNVVMPILARSWGCCLQFLGTSFPTLDDDPKMKSTSQRMGEEPILHWPAFGVHHEIDAKSPIVSLEWLNERSLAYLTTSYELTLVDTVMMTLLERLDFSNVKLVYAEFTLSRTAEKPNADGIGTMSGACCTTFLNSTRCSDDRIMMICQDDLRCISIVGARRRIAALEADGEWLEALAFALDHYENTVVSQEDRRRDPNAKKDFTRHPEFSAAKSEEEEWIAKLLVRYLNLAVDNAPDSTDQPIPNSPHHGGVSSRIDLAQSHFQMLAGVCVEFCVATRRLDLLFGPIFRRFQSAGYVAVFLDVLEPYVLNDKLKYIAPEVMSFLVEHCKVNNGISTVERCLLHMDCTIMDFDSILTLLRTNEMYTALFYVFNQGLDDYVSPLEIILEKVFSEADRGGATTRRKDGVLQNDFERYGYKALLYLQACFAGKTFPQETRLEPESRAHSLKLELLRFLMQEKFSPSTHVKKAVNLIPEVGQRSLLFPYIRVLLLVDPRGMLHTLSIALDSANSNALDGRSRSTSESVDGWVDGGSINPDPTIPLPDLQEIMVDIAAVLLPKSPTDHTLSEANVFKSRGAVNAYLDFAAKYIINGSVRMEKSIVFKVLTRVAGQYASARDTANRQMYQRKTMDILSALPRDSYDPDKVLTIFNQSGMHRAALLLHQQVATSWHEAGQDDIILRSQHFLSAIDCYVEDEDKEFRMEVFKYVKKECSGVTEISHSNFGAEPTSLRDALYKRLLVLVNLDPLMTARMVAELLVDEMDLVIDALRSDDGKGQFLFLQAIISGQLLEADPVAGSVINLTMDHHHIYLTLMAKLHPDLVYDYLSTHDNYRTEECLRLCEEYDIADASAYLLERMGKVTNALQLVLQTLETRMMGLKRTIRSLSSDVVRNHTGRPFTQGNNKSRSTSSLPSKHENDVHNVRRILVVALDLCERNSRSLTPANEATSKYKQSELWFGVLDRLINAKGFLRLSKEQPEHAKLMSGVLSELLRLTMQRMVSSVPLSDLVRKVTADHSGSQIGELREMVEGLLATYGFELRVVKGAILSFHEDGNILRRKQLALQLQGSAVRTVMNAELKMPEKVKDVNSITINPIVQSGVLRVSGNGNATVITNDKYSSSRRAENGLIDAVKRLRSRRGLNHNVHSQYIKPSSDISMMTTTDILYYNDEIDPVVDGEHSVGALGEAQHRGRLIMTFHRF